MDDRLQEQRIARADLCRFLAACYYEPAAEFAEERLFDSMAAAAGRIDPALARGARRLGKAFSAQPLEELLVDYTRLFLGPAQTLAQPYGGVWSDGNEDAAKEVLELYREGGFEIDEGFRERPDHIAAELEFLYLLIHQEAAADLRERFLGEHLGRWAPPFIDAVRKGAGTSFYRELAQLTGRMLALECIRAA